MTLSFNDYSILRQIQEAYPNVFRIIRGNVIFNENEYDNSPINVGREIGTEVPSGRTPEISPENMPKGIINGDQTMVGVDQSPNSRNDPTIKSDYRLFVNLIPKLQDAEVRKRLEKWINLVFVPNGATRITPQYATGTPNEPTDVMGQNNGFGGSTDVMGQNNGFGSSTDVMGQNDAGSGSMHTQGIDTANSTKYDPSNIDNPDSYVVRHIDPELSKRQNFKKNPFSPSKWDSKNYRMPFALGINKFRNPHVASGTVPEIKYPT